MFQHYLTNFTIFGKKAIEHEIYGLIFPTIFYGPVTVHCMSSATRIVPNIYNSMLVLPLTVCI